MNNRTYSASARLIGSYFSKFEHKKLKDAYYLLLHKPRVKIHLLKTIITLDMNDTFTTASMNRYKNSYSLDIQSQSNHLSAQINESSASFIGIDTRKS